MHNLYLFCECGVFVVIIALACCRSPQTGLTCVCVCVCSITHHFDTMCSNLYYIKHTIKSNCTITTTTMMMAVGRLR